MRWERMSRFKWIQNRWGFPWAEPSDRASSRWVCCREDIFGFSLQIVALRFCWWTVRHLSWACWLRSSRWSVVAVCSCDTAIPIVWTIGCRSTRPRHWSSAYPYLWLSYQFPSQSCSIVDSVSRFPWTLLCLHIWIAAKPICGIRSVVPGHCGRLFPIDVSASSRQHESSWFSQFPHIPDDGSSICSTEEFSVDWACGEREKKTKYRN